MVKETKEEMYSRVEALANILNERVFPEIRSDENQFQRVKKMIEDEETIETI